MALTGRRLQFLRCLARLCRQAQQPVPYAQVAQALGVSKYTAYDQLRRLVDDGYLTQAYELRAGGRPGRSLALFAPTPLGWQTVAIPVPTALPTRTAPSATSGYAVPLDLMDRAVLYKDRLRQEVISQLARLWGRPRAPSRPVPGWHLPESASRSLAGLQRRLQQAREPLAVATYTLGLWIARGCTQRPREFRQAAGALLSSPWPRPDLSLAGVISALTAVLHRPAEPTTTEVRRLQAIVSEVTREEAAWLWQFVQDALRATQLAPA